MRTLLLDLGAQELVQIERRRTQGESLDLIKALDAAFPDSPPLWPPSPPMAVSLLTLPSWLLLPLPSKAATMLLVGTATGVFVTFLRRSKGAGPAEWSRLGSCDQLPLVMVAGLSHEPKDDTLIAATMDSPSP